VVSFASKTVSLDGVGQHGLGGERVIMDPYKTMVLSSFNGRPSKNYGYLQPEDSDDCRHAKNHADPRHARRGSAGPDVCS
jgi:hypothetical protein